MKNKATLLTEFITGLNEMIGAAGVMIHHQQDLRWEFVRKILEEIKGNCVKHAVDPITRPVNTKFEKKTQIVTL